MLKGRKILLGITGSIAAYKSILLLRLLMKEGAEVKVIMTEAARDFVSPLVLRTLCKHDLLDNLFEKDNWSNHVMLGRWADLMVIAPLSCNTLAKMAIGSCDNLLQAVYLSATCPVIVSPAMDEDMWKHPATRRNISTLEKDGVRVIPVGYGELGSGLVGDGRMAEPEEIIHWIDGFLEYPDAPLKGKKVVVTAGPTYEAIDPVRFIGNHSSGKMGVAIANELFKAGADVRLVLGPSSISALQGIEVHKVITAEEMFKTTTGFFSESDISVFAAAVADFRPAKPYIQKWKKQEKVIPEPIDLVTNPDILKYCGQQKRPDQTVVGFALETENEADNALRKLKEKKASIIVLNSLRDEGAGFGTQTNKITIFTKDGNKIEPPLQSKTEAAVLIVKAIIDFRK